MVMPLPVQRRAFGPGREARLDIAALDPDRSGNPLRGCRKVAGQ